MDSRNNYQIEQRKREEEEWNKRNIPNENYICTGTFRSDTRKENRNSPMERFDGKENLVIDFRNQTIIFQGLTRSTNSSEGMIYTGPSEVTSNSLYFNNEDKTLTVSILDYENGNTELIPGMTLPMVVEELLYDCKKNSK